MRHTLLVAAIGIGLGLVASRQVLGGGEESGCGSASLLMEARRQAENGYLASARSILDEALSREPDDTEVHVLKVEVELSARDVDAAMLAYASLPRPLEGPIEASLATAIATAELECLCDSAPIELRPHASHALHRLDTPSAIEKLASLDWSETPRGTSRLLDLISLREPGLAEFFRKLAGSTRDDLKIAGAAGLASIGERSARETLVRAIDGKDAEAAVLACDAAACAAAADLLPQIRARTTRKDDAVIAAIAAIARLTPDEDERARSIRALRREALAAVNGRRSGVAEAIAALGSIDGPGSREALRTIRKRAPSDWRRMLAECASARLGEADVADALIERIKRAGPEGAMPAATALGHLASRAHLEKLRECLNDGRSDVKAAGAVAFARCGGIHEAPRKLVECLSHARNDCNFEWRLEIASAMVAEGTQPIRLSRPELRRTLDIDVEMAERAPDESGPSTAAKACDAIVRRLAELHEACRVEIAGTGHVVVALRADLGADRIAEIARKIEADGYSVLACARSAEESSDGSSTPGTVGLSP